MVEIAVDARERIMQKQEGKRRQAQRANRKSAKGRRNSAAASGEGKCEKVANPCGACL
jgi:hypothetical protein